MPRGVYERTEAHRAAQSARARRLDQSVVKANLLKGRRNGRRFDYTDEEKAMIRACESRDDLRACAKNLGRTFGAILRQNSRLKALDKGT